MFESPGISELPRQAEVAFDLLREISERLAVPSELENVLQEILSTLHNRLGVTDSAIALLTPFDVGASINGGATFGADQCRETRRNQYDEKSVVVEADPSPQRTRNRGSLEFIRAEILLDGESTGTLSAAIPPMASSSREELQALLRMTAHLIAVELRARRTMQICLERLDSENRRLHKTIEDRFRIDKIIGRSYGMRSVVQQIRQVVDADATVLIRGDCGTGKKLVASTVHYRGNRAARPLIQINTSALNESLLERELFGSEEYALPQPGFLEEADGGTLFLDEIADLSLRTQIKLLRFLQEGEYERCGCDRIRQSNVRIFAGTRKNLEELVEQGMFRRDLYYRINVFPIFLPSLKDRRSDILPLAEHFLDHYVTESSKRIQRLSTPAIDMLCSYHWPGNVQELENCIEYAVLHCSEGVIRGCDLPPTLQVGDEQGTLGKASLSDRVRIFEHEMISESLKVTRGNVAAAARELGITPRILRYKIHKLGIDTQHNGAQGK
jgi:Nif-specific regulatory protein